ncbi:unnamed protein product [Rhizoctonia solani]|uniref:Uncharacterized protein n=1 Tax=Rhizoctonia solani TaxID=456999 RepID=A0A8H3DU58_9AGAM|nr:unnamed protein product [Rhizoctonia solani]
MDIDTGSGRLHFEGELDVNAPLNPSEAEPNGTFYYNKLPENGTETYASYYRDQDGEKAQLVRITFAENPDEGANQLGYVSLSQFLFHTNTNLHCCTHGHPTAIYSMKVTNQSTRLSLSMTLMEKGGS